MSYKCARVENLVSMHISPASWCQHANTTSIRDPFDTSMRKYKLRARKATQRHRMQASPPRWRRICMAICMVVKHHVRIRSSAGNSLDQVFARRRCAMRCGKISVFRDGWFDVYLTTSIETIFCFLFSVL
jgi:hypothetical protein